MEALRARRDQYSRDELVELRLDAVDKPDVHGALQGRRCPVIVTCRAAWEGGHFQGSEDERLAILASALDLGAEYVDIEWKALTPEFADGRGRDRVVVSMHDFSGIPADLESRVASMRGTGAAIVKVAVMTSRLAETATLMERVRPAQSPTVVLAMGEAGLPSRILSARFGSLWTYSADEAAAAPGQVSVTRMRDEFRVESIGPRTSVYGIVGRPVAHSLSPAMHNAAFAALGLDAVYVPLAAHDFDDFRQFAEAIGLAGASVTAPFKVEAFELAGAVDEGGRRARAINTLRRRDSGWDGLNTDAEGFMTPLRGRALDAQRATILGAGGAARTVAVSLREAGAHVTVVARRLEQAQALASYTAVRAAAWPPSAGSWDLLVNATPIGTAPGTDTSPLDETLLDGRLVYDLVYNPPETRLLRDAARRGLEVIGGLDMLVAQACAQFTWWTGQSAPDPVMRAAASQALRQRSTELV
jgi:3-dehydroquinate dehydratase/shikimate dehydrogenase